MGAARSAGHARGEVESASEAAAAAAVDVVAAAVAVFVVGDDDGDATGPAAQLEHGAACADAVVAAVDVGGDAVAVGYGVEPLPRCTCGAEPVREHDTQDFGDVGHGRDRRGAD